MSKYRIIGGDQIGYNTRTEAYLKVDEGFFTDSNGFALCIKDILEEAKEAPRLRWDNTMLRNKLARIKLEGEK